MKNQPVNTPAQHEPLPKAPDTALGTTLSTTRGQCENILQNNPEKETSKDEAFFIDLIEHFEKYSDFFCQYISQYDMGNIATRDYGNGKEGIKNFINDYKEYRTHLNDTKHQIQTEEKILHDGILDEKWKKMNNRQKVKEKNRILSEVLALIEESTEATYPKIKILANNDLAEAKAMAEEEMQRYLASIQQKYREEIHTTTHIKKLSNILNKARKQNILEVKSIKFDNFMNIVEQKNDFREEENKEFYIALSLIENIIMTDTKLGGVQKFYETVLEIVEKGGIQKLYITMKNLVETGGEEKLYKTIQDIVEQRDTKKLYETVQNIAEKIMERKKISAYTNWESNLIQILTKHFGMDELGAQDLLNDMQNRKNLHTEEGKPKGIPEIITLVMIQKGKIYDLKQKIFFIQEKYNKVITIYKGLEEKRKEFYKTKRREDILEDESSKKV